MLVCDYEAATKAKEIDVHLRDQEVFVEVARPTTCNTRVSSAEGARILSAIGAARADRYHRQTRDVQGDLPIPIGG